MAAQSVPTDSLQKLLAALPPGNDTTVQRLRAELQFSLGVDAHYRKQFPEARPHYRAALAYYSRVGAARPLAKSLAGIGFSYHLQGLYPQALDTFLLSLKYYDAARDTGKMAQIATSISNIYWEMPEQRDKALYFARYCMDITAGAKRLHGLCACTHLVGSIYTELGKLDSAELFIKQSLQLLETQPDLPGLTTVYLAMSGLEQQRQRYHEAEKWLQKALITQKNYPNAPSEQEQANLLLELGKLGVHRQNFSDAEKYTQLASDFLTKIQDFTYHERYYDILHQIALAKGRPADALRYYQLQIAARDSVNNAAITRRMTQTQMNFEFEKKAAAQRQEMALRETKRHQQQWLIALSIFFAAGVAAFAFYYYRQQQIKRRTQLELNHLRAQINPHFIFNCLNSIYRYTQERDTETASRYLQKLGSLLRLVLENSRQEKIKLSKDLQALQGYIDIESLRFKGKLQFALDMDPEIDPTFIEIPGMLFQPYIENAIWHGLMPKPDGGQITLRLRLENEMLLYAAIEDNGIGRHAANGITSHKSSSLGQKITAERLKGAGKLAKTTITDLYNEQGSPAGTRIELWIPL